MSLSMLLMLAYLGALFTHKRVLWGITGVLAALTLLTNVFAFVTSFSMMALLSGIFSFLIMSQAAAMYGGYDVVGKIRRWWRRR